MNDAHPDTFADETEQPDDPAQSRAAVAIGCIVLASIIIGARAVWLHLIN